MLLITEKMTCSSEVRSKANIMGVSVVSQGDRALHDSLEHYQIACHRSIGGGSRGQGAMTPLTLYRNSIFAIESYLNFAKWSVVSSTIAQKHTTES